VKSMAFCSGYLVLLSILEGKTLYQSFSEIVDLSALVRRIRALFGG